MKEGNKVVDINKWAKTINQKLLIKNVQWNN